MRKYIVIALVLVAGGVAVSVYLIPKEAEITAAQSPTQAAPDLSQVDVEAEYAKGNKSLPIVAAVADKKVAAGDRPAAVKLLEEYVTANPADINGRKKLAEQYQLSGNNAEFNKQIEAIAAAEPTEANLRVLSDIYNANKEYAKQAVVLQKIVDVTNGANPQSYVDLATIQVAVGDTEGALKTVNVLKDKHPNFSSYPMTRIMVSVLAGQGKADEAFAAAKAWIDSTNAPVPTAAAPAPAAPAAPVAAVAQKDDKPKELADLTNILHYGGYADKAVALVEPHMDMLAREPELVLAYVNAAITAGKSDAAYAVLKQIDESGTMIAALYPPYFDLVLKREDVAAAETIANKMDVTSFSEEQALNTIETVRSHNAPTVLSVVLSRFSGALIAKDAPVLTAVIAILTNDKMQDDKINAALAIDLTSTQRVRLAESCARAKKTSCFDAIVKQYPPLDQQSPTQVAEYAQLFIIADRAGELVEPVGKLAVVDQAPVIVQTAHRRLAAAAGRLDVLKPWLQDNANSVPVVHLQELFYLANDRQHGDVASDIAERLYARDPSPMNRTILVAAYLGAEQYDKAMPLLRDQMREPGANDAMYVSTLSKLARKDAAARKELTDYALAALQTGYGDARQQLNYAYVLINNGRKEAAIPYAKQYATERGGEWKKLYAQLTQKPKAGTPGAVARKLTREQMVAMANNKTISAANKRQIAFNLLNEGHKSDALVVFKELAQNKGPESQEVKDLMFLWGGKLNNEQLGWVQARAANATAYDKARWAELVNNAADDRAILNYVSATPDSLYNRPLRQRYFRILAGTGSRENYETAMRRWVAETTDVPALLDYAKTAQDSGYREAAVKGYERVVALDPSNTKALSQLAVLDFGKGKYRAADQNLNQYMAAQQQRPDPETNPAQAYFLKAELLRRQGSVAEARNEYAQVVALTQQANDRSVDGLSRMYTSQFHLGQHADAKHGFEQLLAKNPDNKSVLADYMSALIEYKYLDDATRIANQYDKTSPYYRKGAMLMGSSAHTASVQQMSGGRELKITFSQPIENRPPVKLSDAKKLAWVEKSTLGYDSLSISAKPGYVVRYVPTSEQQFAVVATPAPEYAPQVEAQRQQDLRLQLLYARIEQDSGQTEKARQRVAVLKQYYPNDPQLLSFNAGIEAASGNRSQALALAQQAQRVAPENEGLAMMVQEFSRPATGGYTAASTQFAKADVEYRNYGAHDEVITTAAAQFRLPNNNELGFNWQHDFISPKSMLIPETGGSTDGSANRDQAEIFLAHYFEDGGRIQGSLFADSATEIGGGLYYAFDNPLGRTELIGEYRKPYWDYAQAVYAYANRDRVGLRHFAQVNKKTALGVETSLNNYNIKLDNDQVQTALVRASVTYEIQPQTKAQPYLGLGYGFDGEYKIDDHDLRLTAGGAGYHPFDWRSREVHYFSGTYRDDWTPTTHAMLTAGYAFDRLNDSGPAAEARITQDLSANWELGLRARYGVITSGGGSGEDNDDAVNVGAHLMYKF